MSPTQLSLKHLRQAGYIVAIVEHFNAFANVRQDLFGAFDILAVKDNVTLAIQTTSSSNMSAPRTKLARQIPPWPPCLKAGWYVEGTRMG